MKKTRHETELKILNIKTIQKQIIVSICFYFNSWHVFMSFLQLSPLNKIYNLLESVFFPYLSLPIIHRHPYKQIIKIFLTCTKVPSRFKNVNSQYQPHHFLFHIRFYDSRRSCYTYYFVTRMKHIINFFKKIRHLHKTIFYPFTIWQLSLD